jgi:hypothetical protein
VIMVKFYEKLWLLKKITNYWHLNFLLLIAPTSMQESDIWSQASYMYAILWEAFLDPSDSYFLFTELIKLTLFLLEGVDVITESNRIMTIFTKGVDLILPLYLCHGFCFVFVSSLHWNISANICVSLIFPLLIFFFF